MGGSYIPGEEEALPADQAVKAICLSTQVTIGSLTCRLRTSTDLVITISQQCRVVRTNTLSLQPPWEFSRSSRKAFGEINQ